MHSPIFCLITPFLVPLHPKMQDDGDKKGNEEKANRNQNPQASKNIQRCLVHDPELIFSWTHLENCFKAAYCQVEDTLNTPNKMINEMLKEYFLIYLCHISIDLLLVPHQILSSIPQ